MLDINKNVSYSTPRRHIKWRRRRKYYTSTTQERENIYNDDETKQSEGLKHEREQRQLVANIWSCKKIRFLRFYVVLLYLDYLNYSKYRAFGNEYDML